MGAEVKTIRNFAIIIDDQEIHAYAAEIMLRKYALVSRTLSFHSAIEALIFLQTIEEPEDFPDYIFADIHMPKVTGFDLMDRYLEIAERLRENCCFVFLSSSRLPLDIKKLQDYEDISYFVEKPLTREKISALARV